VKRLIKILILATILALVFSIFPIHCETIHIKSKRILYITTCNKRFRVCFYIINNGSSTAAEFKLQLIDELNRSYVISINKTTTLYSGNNTICMTTNISRPGLYLARLVVHLPFRSGLSKYLARIIVACSLSDVIVSKNFIVFAIQKPVYSLRFLFNLVNIAYTRYLKYHDLEPAPPCYVGKKLIVIVYHQPYGGGEAITYPPLHCTFFMTVDPYTRDVGLLKHTVAHEMFHTIQARYENSFFYSENPLIKFRYLWLLEGGADAATYFIWGKEDFNSYHIWHAWFQHINARSLQYTPTYRYDPSSMLVIIYNNCIEEGMSPRECYWMAYDYSYSFSPVVLYLFYKLGLNPRTMRMLYSSKYPQDNPEVLKYMFEAYLTYVEKGYIFYNPNIRPQPFTIHNNSIVKVFTRAFVYLKPELERSKYIFYYHCRGECPIDVYIYNPERGLSKIYNSTIINFDSNTYLVILGNISLRALQENPFYSKCYDVRITFVRFSGKLECDFNGDGRLDVGDVVLLLRILIGAYHSNVPCDLNHNGRLDIGDAVLLLKKILQT